MSGRDGVEFVVVCAALFVFSLIWWIGAAVAVKWMREVLW